MRLIYKAVADELAVTGDESKEAVIEAVTSYCLALKQDGNAVPLWTEAGAYAYVHKNLENIKVSKNK
jgi:hypothetical protein